MSLSKSKIAALTLSAAMLTQLTTTSAADNLTLSNPGFESGLTGWTQTFGTGGLAVSSAKAYSGSYSLKITDTSSTQNPGLESTKFSITAGYNYTVSAMANADNGNAEVYIRFYNSTGTYLSSSNVSTATPVGSWTRIGTVGHAPAGATHATVLLYSGKSALATVYYDDVVVKRSFSEIGPQLPISTQIVEAAVGTDSTGKTYMYTVTRGRPAQFNVIDPATQAVIKKFDLPGTEGAAAVTVNKDGDVYVGGYGGATYGQKATMFRYKPGATSVTALNEPIAGQARVEDLTPGIPGKVYGSTSEGGFVFKYETAAGFTQFGGQMVSAQEYPRGIAFDESTKMLYTSAGAHIVKFDTATGAKTELLSASYASGVDEVYTLNLVGGKLFAKLNYTDGTTPSKILVMNKTTGAVEDSFEASSRGVFSKNESSDLVYYSNGGQLYSYTISTKQKSAALGGLDGMTIVGGAVAPLAGGEGLVGMIGNSGKMFTYQNGVVDTSDVQQMPGMGSDIRQVQKGPDGRLYMGGFLTGAGVAAYDPLTGETESNTYLSQVDSIGQLGSSMYFGVYPGAKLYALDTNVSPLQKPVLKDTGGVLSAAGQDRITATLGHAASGRLFLGTAPKKDLYGAGKMWIYTPATGSFTTTQTLVDKQSIIALTEYNGKIYGGTSTWGGGVNNSGQYGKVFSYNPSTGALDFAVSPIASSAVSALVAGPDGNIWGLNQGYVFAVNPATGATVYTSGNLFPNTSTRLGGSEMVVGADGKIYAALASQTVAGTDKILQINPATKEVIVLREDITGGGSLTKDDAGNVYYGDEQDLWKLELK